MKPIISKTKSFSKVEAVYHKTLKDRPQDSMFREIESKVNIYNNKLSEPANHFRQLPGALIWYDSHKVTLLSCKMRLKSRELKMSGNV